MTDTPPHAPDPVAPPPPARRRWRRRRWWLGALLLTPVIALMSLAVLLVWLPTWLPPETLRQEAVKAAREALGVEVDIASLDYDLAWGLRLRGVRVGPPPGFERDLLRLTGLDLLWALPWRTGGAVVIERAALIEPHVVLETRGGVRNLDALFPPGPEVPPAPAAEPTRGPLSPIAIVLRSLVIEDATIELDGEGPELTLSGLGAQLTASLDPSRLDAQLTLTTSVAAGAPANLRVRVPQGEAAPLLLATALRTQIDTAVAVDTHQGIGLERVSLAVRVRAADVELHGVAPLPPADLGIDLGVQLDAKADTLVLHNLNVTLAHRSLFGLTARVDGVTAALVDAVADADALLGGLGLARSTLDGRVTLSGPGLTLALDPLAPYVRAFVPGLRMGGELRLALEEISGRIPELSALRPTRGGARLELERVRVSYPGFSLGNLGGLIALRARGAAPVVLDGRLDGERLRAGPSGIQTLRLGVDGTVEAPAYPATGTTTIAVTLAVGGLTAPNTELDGVRAQLVLHGRDPFDAARAPGDPLAIAIDLALRGLTLTSSAGAQTIATTTVRLDAELDRLLDASPTPIHAKLAANVRGVVSPLARLEGLRVDLDATADDPRPMRPIDARVRAKLELEQAKVEAATLGAATLTLEARASGVDPTGAQPIPATAQLESTLELPALTLTTPAVSTHARIDTRVAFVRAGQVLTIETLRARVADAVDLTLSGKLRDTLQATPQLDLAIALAPLNLSQPLLSKLVGEPFVGTGELRFDAHAKGRWTGVEDLLTKLDAPPLEATVRLALADVGVQMPARALSLEAATGALELELSRARSGTQGTLKVATMAQGPQSARDLEAAWSLGLDEGVWRARATLDAAQLGDASRRVEAASVEIDVAHPPFGDVLVRRFRVRAPGAGVDATIEGRLARARFGAVLPELDARVSIDFDRLKSVFGDEVPAALVPCVGSVGVDLGAHAPLDSRIEVTGALTLEHFGWSNAETRLIDASGRVPLAQRIEVSVPSEALLRHASVSGSALEEGGRGLQASLTELSDALARRSRFVLESNDVLLVSPRTADYESLRPYYRSRSTARLTIAELAYAHYRLRAVSMDVAYRDGVFRLDRFTTSLWDGHLFGEMAFQVAGEDHLRLRLRSTLTDINLDVPVAAATGREPSRGGDATPYQVAGNLDLRVDLRDRSLNGYFDFTKMGSEALMGLIDGIDPERKSRGLQDTRASMDSGMARLALVTGVRLQGTVMTIRNNLLDLDYRWAYDPLELPWSLTGALIVSRLIFGPVVMTTIRSNVQGYSLSNYLEQPWVKALNEAVFVDAIRGRLVVLGDDEAVARGDEP